MNDSKRLLVIVLLLSFASLAWAASNETAPVNFVGMKPCRIADTRGGDGFTGQAGPPALIANASRTFQVTGTVPGLPAQCGIPTSAVAVSINFTVTGFSSGGDLRVYPAGAALPLASIVNFQQENVANATNLALGPVGSEKGFTVRADAASTQFIADINGYFVPRHLTYLESGQTEKGVYAVRSEAPAGNYHYYGTISFPVPVVGSITFDRLTYGAAPTANCPGSYQTPLAAPGHMCLYERNAWNLSDFSVFDPEISSNSVLLGVVVFIQSNAGGDVGVYGTWAVTAP